MTPTQTALTPVRWKRKVLEPTSWTDEDYTTAKVMAGPLGFRAKAFGIFVGPLRETKADAATDADIAEGLVASAHFAGAQAAMSIIR